MKATELIGVWTLLCCEGRSARGDTFTPYGAAPVGRLIYTADGYMSVTLMNSARQPFVSEDISKATSDEIIGAFESYDAYSGRWSLDEKAGFVTHVIDAGRIPNWVGRSHKRFVSIVEGVLTLATEEFSMGGTEWCVRVSWERSSGEKAEAGS